MSRALGGIRVIDSTGGRDSITSALGLGTQIDPCLSHDPLFASIVTWSSYGTPPKVARLKRA